MPSLDNVLANIPGLGGYLAQRQRNEAQPMQDLQQAGALMGILKQQQAAQDEQQLRGVLAQSGGSPEKAVQALMQAGTPRALELATHLRGLMPKPAEPFTLGADQTRFDAGGKAVAFGMPKEVKPDAAPELIRLQEAAQKYPEGNPLRAQIDARIKMLGEKSPQRGVAVMGPDGKPVIVPAGQDIGKTPFSPSLAGEGMLTPETLKFTAEQYLTGDRQAVMGYARNASMRAALQNAIVKEAKDRGMTGADLAAQMADFQGIMSGSRSVGIRSAQIHLASSEADKMIEIVRDQTKKFGPSNFVPWNVALKAFKTQTGDPAIRGYGASINSLVNVYARAINPVGVPTVSDKDHAREILQTIDSPAQVEAVLGVLKQEMAAARSAPEDVRAELRQAVTRNQRGGGSSGGTGNAPAAPITAPGAFPTATGPKGEKIIFKDGKWQPMQ